MEHHIAKLEILSERLSDMAPTHGLWDYPSVCIMTQFPSWKTFRSVSTGQTSWTVCKFMLQVKKIIFIPKLEGKAFWVCQVAGKD
jgi:hypothetical protein